MHHALFRQLPQHNIFGGGMRMRICRDACILEGLGCACSYRISLAVAAKVEPWVPGLPQPAKLSSSSELQVEIH